MSTRAQMSQIVVPVQIIKPIAVIQDEPKLKWQHCLSASDVGILC